MKFSDGSPVKVGDRVWWNEGSAIGYVVGIHEREADFVSLGLSEPGVFIADFMGPNVGVEYPRRVFEDEGIGLLSMEEVRFADKLLAAATRFLSESKGLVAGLRRDTSSDCRLWNVVFFRDGNPVNVVQVDAQTFQCKSVS